MILECDVQVKKTLKRFWRTLSLIIMGWKKNRQPKQSVSVSTLIAFIGLKLWFSLFWRRQINWFSNSLSITFRQLTNKPFNVIAESFFSGSLSILINKSINLLSATNKLSSCFFSHAAREFHFQHSNELWAWKHLSIHELMMQNC